MHKTEVKSNSADPQANGCAQRATALLRWYSRAKRDLPWRKTTDPYQILVSELMLQQTQVITVIAYFHRFMERFPTVQSLAAAPEEEVLRLWAGLGYYRRAIHLHGAAKEIIRRGGKFPETVEGLLQLPGVGRYTAGAVASIAFKQRAAAVDGNVMRVLARWEAVEEDIGSAATQKNLWRMAQRLLPSGNSGDYNQAVMELGATVCVVKRPQCQECPVRQFCRGNALGLQNQLPKKASKQKQKTIRRAVLLIESAGKLLMMQRPKGVIWAGLWEFPAIEIKPGCNLPRLLADEVNKILHCRAEWQAQRLQVSHELTHRRVLDEVFVGRVQTAGEVKLPAGSAYQRAKWVAKGSIDQLPVARAVWRILEAVEEFDS